MADLPFFPDLRAKRLKARNRALSDEAIDWLVQLGTQGADGRLRQDFENWLARSPAHVEAARDAADMLEDLGHTRAALEYRELKGVIDRSGRPKSSPLTRRALIGGAIAASAALTVGYGGIMGPVSGLLADYATGVGERKSVTLPDGSVMWLNTASAVSLAFGHDLRRIRLHDGEVLFQVAAEALRPFVVSSGGGQALAVGTRFSMRRLRGHTEVSVIEGRVNVSNGKRSAGLSGGQMIRYGTDILGAVETTDTQAVSAWHRGKLIFNRQSLVDVIAEIERYERGRIVIMDEALKGMRVSGVFDLEDLDGALRTIADTVRLKVMRLPMLTLIRSA
ncbi:MAG: FecR domain-containing protein [Asticcacaulis sp.]